VGNKSLKQRGFARMSAPTQQQLMARYHHLRDHLADLDKERNLVKEELDMVIAALLKQCQNKTIPN